jgi:hypothetical protein
MADHRGKGGAQSFDGRWGNWVSLCGGGSLDVWPPWLQDCVGVDILEAVPSKDVVEDGVSSLIPCKTHPARLKIAGPGELSSTFQPSPTIMFLTPYHIPPIVNLLSVSGSNPSGAEPRILDTIGLQLPFQAKIASHLPHLRTPPSDINAIHLIFGPLKRHREAATK